jgi:hypothetical protein
MGIRTSVAHFGGTKEKALFLEEAEKLGTLELILEETG